MHIHIYIYTCLYNMAAGSGCVVSRVKVLLGQVCWPASWERRASYRVCPAKNARLLASMLARARVYQDPPYTLQWGYMVPNTGYLGFLEGRRRV